jgi:hypothetical protein
MRWYLTSYEEWVVEAERVRIEERKRMDALTNRQVYIIAQDKTDTKMRLCNHTYLESRRVHN